MFKNIERLKENGFVGFKTIQELFEDSSSLPAVKGVYMIININQKKPAFLKAGSGGFFKGKDPNISLEDLQANWINNTHVVYIGKAGGGTSNATLKRRLGDYLKFGQGRNIGHYGGRLIWQLASYSNLIVCWKPLPNEEPRVVEAQLIKDFTTEYGNRPFANLAN